MIRSRALDRTARALRPHAVALVLAALGIGVAWMYAATTLHHTSELGLPLDDSYIYLTYAKQIGRGQPFTYFPGGGYSPGATSVAWPILLAPVWTLGARGHALVWAAFVLCALLHATSAVLAYRIARTLAMGVSNAKTWSCEVVGAVVGLIVVGIPAFAWTALSGMEVALASALLLSTIGLLVNASRPSPHARRSPSRLLIACLAATALARPELGVIVVLVCIALAITHRRERRVALWWLAPLIAPILWVIANRVLAGHFLPSTAIAKSQLFQPGFEWGAWWSAFVTNAGKLVRGLFWDQASPLPQARLFAIAWIAGVARLAWWTRGRSASERMAVALVSGAPLAIAAMVLASSGLWTQHQYRYIAPVFPLLAIPVGVAIAPVARWVWSARASAGVAAVVAAGVVWFAASRYRTSMTVWAQAASDTNAQVVKLGRYVRDRLPAARVMLHDAGAIAYYSDAQIVDLLGLVTDDTMSVASHGPGARFEYLEALPAERRPTHIAYYPGWLGSTDFLGRLVTDTPLRAPFTRERLIGGKNMELVEASWDHAGTGERPLAAHAGWHVVDRVDVADLASERAHGWTGAIGVRGFADVSARWSFVARDITDAGLVIDGGRTIRGKREAFVIARDATRAARLVLRTGGSAAPSQETIASSSTLHVTVDGVAIGALIAAAPSGRMVEVEIALPPGAATRIAISASAPYRAFHWFVLQPE